MLQVKKANKLRAVPDETTNSDNTVSEIRQVKAKKIKETKVEHKDSTTTQEKKNNNIKVPTVSDTVAIQAPVVSALPEKLEESVNRFCVGGGLHYRAKEYEDAINSYNNALKIKPYCVEAFCGLAMSYEKLKKYDQAISFFIKAVTFESNNALMFQHLGLSYEAVGRYNEALEAMDKAVQIDPFYKSEYKAMAKRIRKLQK
jgi:tetratricopeptide (TPR) repeat protein